MLSRRVVDIAPRRNPEVCNVTVTQYALHVKQLVARGLPLTVVLRLNSIRFCRREERMQKTQTLNLRVSPEFKRRLIAEAKKEKRSVTNYLEVTLAEVWKAQASPKKGTRDF